MARFSLVGELPELTSAMNRLAELARAEGVEFVTADFGGVRTEPDTVTIMRYRDEEYARYVRDLKAKNPNAIPQSKEEWRKIAPFGKSKHNYGAARDVRPVKWPKGKSFQCAHDKLDELVDKHPELGLRSGDSFNDEPHFELRITIAEAKARYLARVGTIAGGGALVLLAVGGLILYSLKAA